MNQEKGIAHFRILGAMIPRLVGREVCVIGRIISVTSGGQEFSMKCADGTEIKCFLSSFSPIEASSVGCVVEVQALIKNSSEIETTTGPIVFSTEASNTFDMERYCYAVNLTASFDRLYTQHLEE